MTKAFSFYLYSLVKYLKSRYDDCIDGYYTMELHTVILKPHALTLLAALFEEYTEGGDDWVHNAGNSMDLPTTHVRYVYGQT